MPRHGDATRAAVAAKRLAGRGATESIAAFGKKRLRARARGDPGAGRARGRAGQSRCDMKSWRMYQKSRATEPKSSSEAPT